MLVREEGLLEKTEEKGQTQTTSTKNVFINICIFVFKY